MDAELVDNLDPCRLGNDYDGNLGLRIVSIVVILVISCVGVCFPLLVPKIKWLKLSGPIYYFVKFFGTGIIVGTAWVHLLIPSFIDLGSSPCLFGLWKAYNYSHVFAIFGFFMVFLLHILSLRYVHMKYMKDLTSDKSEDTQDQIVNNIHNQVMNDIQGCSKNDANAYLCGNNGDSSKIHMGSGSILPDFEKKLLNKDADDDMEKKRLLNKYMIKKNFVKFFILEFGMIFHSITIGLTLAVASNNVFITLFVALIFHQLFEGLALGTRLLDAIHYSKARYNWCFAIVYGITTPTSIAVGLLIKSSYNPRSPTAIIVSGVLNSFSGGILMFSGFIELLVDDYIINSDLRNGNPITLFYTLFCFILGYAVMAFVGQWI